MMFSRSAVPCLSQESSDCCCWRRKK